MRSNSANTIAFDVSLVREGKEENWVSLGSLLAAASQGLSKARTYERLACKSDADLAALGLRREDLPRIVMFGRL